MHFGMHALALSQSFFKTKLSSESSSHTGDDVGNMATNKNANDNNIDKEDGLRGKIMLNCLLSKTFGMMTWLNTSCLFKFWQTMLEMLLVPRQVQFLECNKSTCFACYWEGIQRYTDISKSKQD